MIKPPHQSDGHWSEAFFLPIFSGEEDLQIISLFVQHHVIISEICSRFVVCFSPSVTSCPDKKTVSQSQEVTFILHILQPRAGEEEEEEEEDGGVHQAGGQTWATPGRASACVLACVSACVASVTRDTRKNVSTLRSSFKTNITCAYLHHEPAPLTTDGLTLSPPTTGRRAPTPTPTPATSVGVT